MDQFCKPHRKRYALPHLCCAGDGGGGRFALFLQPAEQKFEALRQKSLPERGILARPGELDFGDR